jgi:hypothetical protein
MPALKLPLLRRTTCPHCWTTFAPAEVLWVSSHSDLLGDPRLGPEQQQRFLPTRFNLEGNALDGKGFACHTLACPRCHLRIPRSVSEMESFFVSILGTPACGKSYYLTALTWELRRVMPMLFGLSFADADTISNRNLNECEELLFLNSRGNELLPLADLIRKTELQGELYDTVSFGNQTISYPRPLLFTIQPKEHHPKGSVTERFGRVLCLYDNAGEHFQAGQDSTATPVTQHVAQSRLLLFLFDPTQDQRFRDFCREKGSHAMEGHGQRSSRQETVLQETAARVRKYTGLAQSARHPHPLVVVLTKYDAWGPLLGDKDRSEPWIRQGDVFALDLNRIEDRSHALRALMLKLCPEVVSAAEGFVRNVLYVAVSALGRAPVSHPQSKKAAVKPCDIQPLWATVPLLYGVSRCMPGLIAGKRSTSTQAAPRLQPSGSVPSQPANHQKTPGRIARETSS